MLQPLQIRASDLERIPREGSLSTSPEDLPAPGVAPTKQVLRSRVIGYAVLATPGVPTGSSGPVASTDSSANPVELECKPLKVIDGRDYVINTAGDSSDSSKGPLGSGRQVIGSGLQPTDSTVSINPVDLVFFCLSVIIAVMIIQIIFNNFIFPTIFDVTGEVYKRSLWIHALFGIPIMIGIIVGSTYPWP
jgi:hypothetical protein